MATNIRPYHHRDVAAQSTSCATTSPTSRRKRTLQHPQYHRDVTTHHRIQPCRHKSIQYHLHADHSNIVLNTTINSIHNNFTLHRQQSFNHRYKTSSLQPPHHHGMLRSNTYHSHQATLSLEGYFTNTDCHQQTVTSHSSYILSCHELTSRQHFHPAQTHRFN